MSGLFNPFNNNSKNNSNNQQNVGDFNVPQQVNPSQHQMTQQNLYQNETEMYQKNLINSKNQSDNLIIPRKKGFDNSYYQQAHQTPQFVRNNNREIVQQGYVSSQNQNIVNNSRYNEQFSNMNQNYNMNQNINMNQNYNNHNNLQQEYLDFENQNYIDYGNYRDENQYNGMAFNQQQIYQNNFYPQQHNNNFYNEQPLYEDYQNYNNNNMQYGYSEFSNNNQFFNPSSRYNYNPNINYAQNSANYYSPYNHTSYKNRLQSSSVIPKPISKEIRSEKVRIFFMFIIGSIGIVTSSIMLAVYYKTAGTEEKIIGLNASDVMYPFFSIFMLIIAVAFFGVSLTDYTLLHSNVKKYERELLLGSESVPYFITRNYRSLISRAVFLNWISFSFYIIGAIVLGCLYGLQAQYETQQTEIYILFWKIGELKSLESEITVTIIVLFTVLAVHVANIITSRSRKNNIISYYGYEIIPQQEIREIRKKANKICMIIFFICLAIILFLIVIPWLIIRKKRGQSLKPWGTAN